METILSLQHIAKHFGGLQALTDVNFDVRQGEIFALIGPNGAGKTTLFNIIAGVYPASSGKVVFKGREISRLRTDKRCKMGIARTFQITKPFSDMTVLENVSIGKIFGRDVRVNLLSAAEQEKSYGEAEEILRLTGLEHKKDALAGTLNVPERKRLELCRALATKPDLLLLDEVIAGLNPSEVGGMVELIREINRGGITVLMIEHIMRAVMSVAEEVAVLNFGKIIAQSPPAEVVKNPEVIEAYLGKGRG